MAEGSKAAKRQKTTDGDDEDRLSALPEDLLNYILSFLSSRDLVQQTCMLSRGWRNRWKSVPTLCISNDDDFESADEMTKFVNYLVALRGHNPLVECKINFWHVEEAFTYIDLWTRYAMTCKVQILRITSEVEDGLFPLPCMPCISNHLATLDLCNMKSVELVFDFSGCVSLKDLRIRYSTLVVQKILSPSVKRLRLSYCTFPGEARARISVPNISTFKLAANGGLTPFLDNMPQLESAIIRHDDFNHDCCNSKFEIGGCADVSCRGCAHTRGEGNKSVVLASLSCALNLELLTTEVEMIIFRRDLFLCPVFSKLKSLVVNEWCMVADVHALIFFLQLSPVLEKLTLLISKDDGKEVAKKAKYKGAIQASNSFKQLTVEVECVRMSERIKKKLEVLTTFGVPPKQIKVYQYSLSCWRAEWRLEYLIGKG